ncbi:sulfite reductase subunit alpha [Povalibacter sp.]|uniref:sulfite reductase subunit alpha n=1 Tax=Povalibacter sp. TaxID=1962978 RepID=UPI002F3F413D
MIESIGIPRLLVATSVLIVYVAFVVACLRPKRRDPARAIDGIQDITSNDAVTLVAFASQTGFAEQLASQTARSLTSASSAVQLASLATLSADDLPKISQALFVVSTTGEGDAPDPAARFVRDSLSRSLPLENLRYGVLALGDREYDNFCAFGHRLDAWLRHQGATPLFDVVEVDNGDEGALRHWQHQLSVLSGSPDLADWDTPSYERWRLTERTLANPGSAGDPCYHVVLQPQPGSNADWQAGDIVEIDPQNSTWNATTAALPHREYSIASVPAEGAIHLLIRRMQRPDGKAGLGSGWLTQQAAIGSDIALRIRPNSNFHVPRDSRPMILIGNGTGIAGLRALLKARIDAGHRRNWLLFGERHAAHDRFYRSDLDAWSDNGSIERLDLVFSRDQFERIYVQHRLLERPDALREWIAAGAAIYVCGSLQGMAPAVDAALTHILGADIVEQMTIEGRYCRDVY